MLRPTGVSDPASTGTLIHGDLHYENVLAADREPWLVIDPKPMSGDPHYEIAPMLWDRWDELAGYVREGVRRRFHTLSEAADRSAFLRQHALGVRNACALARNFLAERGYSALEQPTTEELRQRFLDPLSLHAEPLTPYEHLVLAEVPDSAG